MGFHFFGFEAFLVNVGKHPLTYNLKNINQHTIFDAAVFGVSRSLGPTHTKHRRVVFERFFEVLTFTDTDSVVNGKTLKKSMQKRRGGFRCVKTIKGYYCINTDAARY